MTNKNDDMSDFEPEDYPDFDEDDYMDFDDLYSDLDSESYWQEPDFLLADIVHLMVNIAGLEIGVTLFVKGMTITGVLSSEQNYLKDLSEKFRKRIQVNRSNMSKKQEAEFDAMFDFTHLSESTIMQELDEEAGVMTTRGASSIRFLHIKNPVLVGPQGVMNFAQGETPYIRLRLTMIDGWMLGEVVSPDLFMDDDDHEVLH